MANAGPNTNGSQVRCVPRHGIIIVFSGLNDCMLYSLTTRSIACPRQFFVTTVPCSWLDGELRYWACTPDQLYTVKALALVCNEPTTHPTGIHAGKHVVFGEVTDGMDVVKAVEAMGSRSGRTSDVITITDCGQLA